MRLFAAVGLTLLVSGCTANSSGHYTQSVESWRGSNTKYLTSIWGAPYQIMPLSGGNKLFVFKRQGAKFSQPTFAPSIGIDRTRGTSIITALPDSHANNNHLPPTHCLTLFTANAQGTILDTDIQGANCYINESDANALANQQHRRSR